MLNIRIGSIPPTSMQTRSASPKKQNYKAKGKPSYRTMSTKGLQELLERASSLAQQLKEVVKTLPSDENLTKLDKMEHVILQLKQQIRIRSEKAGG